MTQAIHKPSMKSGPVEYELRPSEATIVTASKELRIFLSTERIDPVEFRLKLDKIFGKPAEKVTPQA